MLNLKWTKELTTMGDNEKTEWRLAQLETGFTEIKKDITEIKESLTKLLSKFDGFSPNQCGLHSIKMQTYEERLEKLETTTDGLNKKIIGWTAIVSVVLFILSQLLIPYVLNGYKVEKKDAKIENIQLGTE